MRKLFIFLAFQLMFCLVSTQILATKQFDPENVAIVVAPRYRTGAGQAMVEYPYIIEQAKKPFYKISINGTNLSVFSLGQFNVQQKLSSDQLMNVETLWSYVDSLISTAPQLKAGEQEFPKGKLIIFPFFPDTLAPCRLEYRTLHMTRKEFIETQTDPAFYSVSYQGVPLNFFILPTAHSLPFEVLHSDLRKVIHAIAQSEGSQLIQEVGPDFYDVDDRPVPEDPRTKLNMEECIQRDLKCFAQLYEKIYQDVPLVWAQKQNEKEASLRKTYQNGWTKSLDLESQGILSLLAQKMEMGPEYFDGLDPYYFYLQLNSLRITDPAVFEPETSHQVVPLDRCIAEIFSHHQKPIVGLENEDVRDEAMREQNLAKQSTCNLPFDIYKPLIEKDLKNISLSDEREQTVYHQTLDDLDFYNPYQMLYLKDGSVDEKVLVISVYMNERSKLWWKETVEPLLEIKANSSSKQSLPSDLVDYGLGHNTAPFSIVDLIRKKEGFEAHRVKRSQFNDVIKMIDRNDKQSS